MDGGTDRPCQTPQVAGREVQEAPPAPPPPPRLTDPPSRSTIPASDPQAQVGMVSPAQSNQSKPKEDSDDWVLKARWHRVVLRLHSNTIPGTATLIGIGFFQSFFLGLFWGFSGCSTQWLSRPLHIFFKEKKGQKGDLVPTHRGQSSGCPHVSADRSTPKSLQERH